MKHVFVFDPKVFSNQSHKMDIILDNIGQFFRTQEKPDYSVLLSRQRREAVMLIQKEVESAKENDTVRVYAVGGSGILYDCLNGVAELPNTELVVVPHEETSDFLCNFGEDTDELFRNIPAIVQQGKAIPTDVINWDVNYALNSCSIGLNSAITSKFKKYKSNPNKFVFFSMVLSLINYISTIFDKRIAAQHYKITIDNKDYSGNYCLIHAANGSYYSGKMTGASKAVPNDGLLDIALLKSGGILKTMWSLGRYYRGKTSSNCILVQAKEITIHSDDQMWIQLDNEYVQDNDISLKVVPHAVKIVTLENLSYQKL